MTIKDSKWFCPEPFSNIFVTTDGQAAPCCVAVSWPDHHKTHNIGEWQNAQNSETFKELRTDLARGFGKSIDKHCGNCIRNEQAGSKSHRQNYLDRLTDSDLNLIDYHYIDGENYIPPVVKSIQIKALAGNYCNLSCQMCHASESSSLSVENRKLGIPDNHPKSRPSKYLFPWSQDGLDEYLLKTDEIKLVGGETLAVKSNYDILKRCVELGTSKDTNVHIITNSTIFPKFDGNDIFDYIPLFKKVIINCSVEIWGEENDYIRYPSKWSDTEFNIRRLDNTEADVIVVSTVNALNIGYLHKMDFHQYSFTSVVDTANPFSISSIPSDIRSQLNVSATQKRLLDVYPYDKDNMVRMLDILRMRDAFRKTSLVATFPEWSRYY